MYARPVFWQFEGWEFLGYQFEAVNQTLNNYPNLFS